MVQCQCQNLLHVDMAGRQSSWLASLCLFMCIFLSLGGKSIVVSSRTKALDDKTMFFATQAVTSERIIGNGVKSPSRARRHIGRQLVAHFACKLMQHSCLALTLIAWNSLVTDLSKIRKNNAG